MAHLSEFVESHALIGQPTMEGISLTLTLAESPKLTLDQLQCGVIETFVQESSILDRLPLVQVEGSAFKYSEESSLPGVAFRAINEAYPESTGTLNQRVEPWLFWVATRTWTSSSSRRGGISTINVQFRLT